jgi:pimeloyl-ACP methyl ester carboxylesterase
MGQMNPRRRNLVAAGLGLGLASAAAQSGRVRQANCIDPAPPAGKWRHYVSTRRGQIHFVTMAPPAPARRAPPLCCLHPSPTSGDMYRDLQQVLATDRVVHCPDTPGFGNSDPPLAKPRIEDYGAALADAIAALGAGRVDLFGFHTGSLCAIEIALQRPELIRRVILSGVPHYLPEERDRQRRQNVPGYPYFTDRDYVGKLYQRLVLDASNSGTPEQRLTRFGERLKGGVNGWWGPDAVFTYDSVSALPRLQQPTLFMAFNEEMTEPTREAKKLVAGAQLALMLDLPIFGFIVAPQRVAAVMREFLS